MVYFILTLLFFASMEVVSKPLMSFINPVTLTFYRFLIGVFVLFLFLVIKKRVKELFIKDTKLLISLGLLGFLNTFFAMSMLQLAVKYGNASTAAVIFSSNPIFVFFLLIILKKEIFSTKKLFGIILGISGVILIVGSKGLKIQVGTIFALLAAVSFAFYTILNKEVLKKMKPLPMNIISFSFGIIAMFLYIIFSHQTLKIPNELIFNIKNLISILYLGIFISAVGYITFINTIKTFSPLIASVIFIYSI